MLHCDREYIKKTRALIIITLMFCVFGCSTYRTTKLNNLEDFEPIKYDFATYLIFNGKHPIYDSKLRRNSLTINQIDEKGKLIHRYLVYDDRITTFKGYQKGENKAYLVQLGLVIPKLLWEYNLSTGKFKPINYQADWHEDTGLTYQAHIGKDIWITTLTSHLSGNQIDSMTGRHGILDSTCNLTKGFCFENDRNTFSSEIPVIEFDDGNVLVTRMEQVDISETAIELYLKMFLYDENGVLIKEKKIDDNRIYNSFFMCVGNEIWIIPFYEEGDFLESIAYRVNEALEYKEIPLNNNKKYVFGSGIFQFPFSENQTIMSTGHYIYLVTVENESINITEYEYEFTENVSLDIKSVDFEKKEIYAIAWGDKNCYFQVFDFDFKRIKSIQISSKYIDGAGYVTRAS